MPSGGATTTTTSRTEEARRSTATTTGAGAGARGAGAGVSDEPADIYKAAGDVEGDEAPVRKQFICLWLLVSSSDRFG